MIVIQTRNLGNRTEASAIFDDHSFYAEGRSGALAISIICDRIAKKNKKAIGERWLATNEKLSGVIGQTTKRKRRTRLSENPNFELAGGKMANE